MSRVKPMPSMKSSPHRKVSPPPWRALAASFPDERDCLASFLALEAAEAVCGIKPGNLINVANRKRPCGRNPYELWHAHGAALLAGTGLDALVLDDRGGSLLLYLYRRDLLQEILDRKSVSVILGKCSYREPSNLSLTLAQLKSRVKGKSFPHEIGIFLGYPLKDVLGFMGQIALPFACQGPWKIYGKPEQSLELADRYRRCRCRMARLLLSCGDPVACLRQAA